MMEKFICINDFKNSAGDVIFKIEEVYYGKSNEDEVEMLSKKISQNGKNYTYVFSAGKNLTAWVYSEHFITLAEYRQQRIEEIIS